MKRILLIVALFVLPAVASAVAYQAAARERDYRALLARGDAALGDDQANAAIEAYSGAIALRADSMLAHLRRGEAYQYRGELDEAARDFRTAAALDPTAPRPLEALGDVLYQLRWYGRAADIYRRNLRLDDRAANVSYKLALAQYRNGDVSEAVSTLASTLTLNPRLVDAHYLMGLCLRDVGRPADAVAAFQQTASLSPRLIAAHEQLSDLYAALGRHTDEITELRALATLEPEQVERQVAIAVAQLRADDEEHALATLGTALEHTTDQDVVYRALGKLWLDHARVQPADRVSLGKAIEALGHAAQRPDASSNVLTLYGEALLLDGQAPAAELIFQQATTRYPIEPGALPLYADAAERQAHLDIARQALVDYTGLAAEDTDQAPIAAHIAALSVALGDPTTAVTWLLRATSLAPGNSVIVAALVDAQIRIGQTAEARATLARGLERDPTFPALLALTKKLP